MWRASATGPPFSSSFRRSSDARCFLDPCYFQSEGYIVAQQGANMTSAFGDFDQALKLILTLRGGDPQFKIDRLHVPAFGASARKRRPGQVEVANPRRDPQRHQQT